MGFNNEKYPAVRLVGHPDYHLQKFQLLRKSSVNFEILKT
jgi:hypothetical protein